MEMECLSRTRVVAGGDGLDREVHWITVGEEPDLPDWVFGGELILSTLFAVEPERRAEYVKRLSDRGVAGLMLKPERFLGSIPGSILEVANQESFPVVEVPADVLWSRVLESYYRRTFSEQTERIRMETEMRLRGGFLDELLEERMSGKEILRQSALLGCDLSGGGMALVFGVADFDEISRKKRLDELQVQYLRTVLYETMNGAVRELHSNYICLPRAANVALLIGRPLEDPGMLAAHVLARCRERLRDLPVHAGVGEARDLPEQVFRSYREAESALNTGRRLPEAESMESRIHIFGALGLQRLLFGLGQESPEALREFCGHTLGPVAEYDEEHGTQLMETLRAYIECDGKISGVAEVLHVHKHTVRYRLRRITELTGLDPANLRDAAQLYLAVRSGELL